MSSATSRTRELRARVVRTALAAALTALALGATSASAAEGGNSEAAKRCHQGGYARLMTSTGQGFANQGECVSYAARGGTLQLKPTAAERYQQVCEAAGGVFRIDASPEGEIWRCDANQSFLPRSTYDPLAAICSEAGGRINVLYRDLDFEFIDCEVPLGEQ